jgi:hypothetical protein
LEGSNTVPYHYISALDLFASIVEVLLNSGMLPVSVSPQVGIAWCTPRARTYFFVQFGTRYGKGRVLKVQKSPWAAV